MADRAAIAEAEDVLTVPYDTADAATVNAARKKDARKRRERLDVVAGLMDLKQGRAWMHDFLAACHIFQTTFVAGQMDMSAFREGERNMGLRILADVMAAAPEKYIVMMDEARANV